MSFKKYWFQEGNLQAVHKSYQQKNGVNKSYQQKNAEDGNDADAVGFHYFGFRCFKYSNLKSITETCMFLLFFEI